MFEELKEKFRSSDSSKKFPVFSFSILSGITAILASNSHRDLLFGPISFIKKNLQEDSSIPFLESQKKEKPTIMFDFNNFLSNNRFSWSRFDFITEKRAFCEEFLFNIAHYYEIISLSDRMATIGHSILDDLDPLGCITYRIFLNDKKLLDSNHLCRDLSKLVIISTTKNEFNKDFDKNIIKLEPYNGKKDNNLLDMMHFFINLHYMNLKDFRSTLESYKNTDFIDSFKKIQRKLFQQRNMLSFKNFDKKINEINSNKIKEYKNVKENIKEPPKDYKNIFTSIIKNFLL